MIPASLMAAALLAAGAATADESGPIGPSMVTLDFRSRPVPEVVAAIGQRSGNATEPLGVAVGGHDEPPTVSLEAAEPVPFWEAVDRLCATADLQRHPIRPRNFGDPKAGLQFVRAAGPGAGDYGPAQYVGPFRIGLFAIRMHYQQTFEPQRPSFYDVGPFSAEFRVQAEPRVVALMTGPPRLIEAVDERGQSLIEPEPDERVTRAMLSWSDLGDTTIRIPLRRSDEQGRRLVRLRGVLPVEAAVRPGSPALDLPLIGAEGRSYPVDDMVIRVLEYRLEPSRHVRVRLDVRLVGPRGDVDRVPDTILTGRLRAVHEHLLELVGPDGETADLTSGGAMPEGNLWRMSYLFSDPVPTRLRVYAPDWERRDVPFTFADVPIP